jgi:hypothetical protein
MFIVRWEWDCGTLSIRNLGFNALIIVTLDILPCTLYLRFIFHYIQHNVSVSALLATKSYSQRHVSETLSYGCEAFEEHRLKSSLCVCQRRYLGLSGGKAASVV